jgi:nitroreductase
MNYTEAHNALVSRYAVKKFDPSKKLTEEQLTLVEDVLHLAPSSFGLEPWKFIIITDDALKQKLYPYSMKNSQVRDASALVVLCAKEKLTKADVNSFIRRVASVRNIEESTLAGFKKVLHGFRVGKLMNSIFLGLPRYFTGVSGLATSWAENQAFIALGSLLTVCAERGVDACPMGGFHERKYKAVLSQHTNLEGYTPVVLCALGTRASDDSFAQFKKVRKEKSDVIVRI